MLLITALSVAGVMAGTVTTYSDRATFNAAVGATTVEDFGPVYRFPISTGVLNSATNLIVDNGPAITPGLIKPGVTYSVPIDAASSFNIDEGGGFVGGFLDSIGSTDLTVTFDGPVRALGFDTNVLMSDFSLTLNFISGSPLVLQVVGPTSFDLSFFGYQSDAQDIASAVVRWSGRSGFGFVLDNFTFTDPGTSGAVPEPSALSLLGIGLAGFAALSRLRR